MTLLTFGQVTYNFRCGCSSNQVVFIVDTDKKGYRLCPHCYNPILRPRANYFCRLVSYCYPCKDCSEFVTRTTKWPPGHYRCTTCRRKAMLKSHDENVVIDSINTRKSLKSLKPKSQKHKCICPMCRKEHIYSGRMEWATKTKWRYCDTCRYEVGEIGEAESHDIGAAISNKNGLSRPIQDTKDNR